MAAGALPALAALSQCASLITCVRASWELSRMARAKKRLTLEERKAVRMLDTLEDMLEDGTLSEEDYDDFCDRLDDALKDRDASAVRRLQVEMTKLRAKAELELCAPLAYHDEQDDDYAFRNRNYNFQRRIDTRPYQQEPPQQRSRGNSMPPPSYHPHAYRAFSHHPMQPPIPVVFASPSPPMMQGNWSRPTAPMPPPAHCITEMQRHRQMQCQQIAEIHDRELNADDEDVEHAGVGYDMWGWADGASSLFCLFGDAFEFVGALEGLEFLQVFEAFG